MFKKIFAVVTENDFYKFRAKCSREGYTMGEAFNSIIHNYVNTRDIKLPNKIGKRPVIVQDENNQEEGVKNDKGKKKGN